MTIAPPPNPSGYVNTPGGLALPADIAAAEAAAEAEAANRPPDEGLHESPFPIPEPGSLWSRTIFDCTYDPVEMVRSAFYVRTKAATVVPFNFFRTQELYASQLDLFNIVVKPRQVGMSTFHLGIMTALAVTTPNINQLVITHRDDATKSMQQTIRKNIQWLNEFHGMGIKIGVDNADMMEITNTDSWFFFGSGTAPGVGRSRTIQIMLASELAHWPGENPGAEFSAMTESIPDGGLVFAESTPNGAAGPFYEVYNGKNNGYKKHFFPWFIEPSRRIKFADPDYELDLTHEEQILVNLHNLDHEQIAWRRVKWNKMKDQGLYFPQEYPEDDITCFVAGLKSAFAAERMATYFNIARVVPSSKVDIPGESADPGGTLEIWEQPRTGVQYVAAADVSAGHVEGDYSVLIVRDRTNGKHVATLSGHWSPTSFARECLRVATYYNTALLSGESNGLGLGFVNALDQSGYPELFMEQRGDRQGWDVGFNVSATSKNWIMGKMISEFNDGRFFSYDLDLLRQMSTARLEKKKQYGRYVDTIEMPQHVHDDHFMAYAQSCMLMEQPASSTNRAAPRRGM